jgi:guanylate kinase
MTKAESVLWECLRGTQLGFQFRRQHPIYGYIPDFVCLKKRLVVEVDGGYHFVGNQPLSDEERTRYLKQYGFDVIRFTNDEVLTNIELVIKKIQQAMNNKPTINDMKNQVNALAPSPLRGDRGGLIIFSAPSGSGKSTIVQWLMQEHPELKLYFSISATSRAPRGTEQNGVEYFFLTPEEFRTKIQNDEFLEYEEVYQDRFYGTLKEQVERQLEAGQNVVFDVDVKGGVNIKKFYGERAMSLFIQPPSVEELRRRLVGRGTDTPEAIENRLAKAEYEMTFAPQFDHIVVNDNLEAAKAETLQLVQKFLNQKN